MELILPQRHHSKTGGWPSPLTGHLSPLPEKWVLVEESALAAIYEPSPRKYSSEDEEKADNYPRKCGPVGLRTNPCVITRVPEISLRERFPSHRHRDGSKQNSHNPKGSVAERWLFLSHDSQFYQRFSPASAH